MNFDPIKSSLLRITIPDHQPLLLCPSPCPLIVSALEYSRSAVYGINYCEWPRKQLSCDSECPVPPAHPQVTSGGNRNTVDVVAVIVTILPVIVPVFECQSSITIKCQCRRRRRGRRRRGLQFNRCSCSLCNECAW